MGQNKVFYRFAPFIQDYIYSHKWEELRPIQVAAAEDRIYFIRAEFKRVGAYTNITPREMIRDFIELMNIAYQNPDRTLPQLMGEELEFSKGEGDNYDNNDGFGEFEL